MSQKILLAAVGVVYLVKRTWTFMLWPIGVHQQTHEFGLICMKVPGTQCPVIQTAMQVE